ncbi:MAG: hypothetical protein ACREDN_09840, partial [Aestuariivirga sp.]
MKTLPKTFFVICLAGTLLTLPVAAADVPVVVRVLLANWKAQMQVEPTYESIDDDGSGNITVNKLRLEKSPGGPPGLTLTIDEIRLEGVSGGDNGLYEIGHATFTGTKASIDNPAGTSISFSMPAGSAEGWYVKDAGENPVPEEALRASMTLARKLSSGPITIEANGQSVTADGYESTWDGDPVTGSGTTIFKLSKVVIPEAAMALADPTGSLKQLGYSGLTFDIEGDGKMDIAGGKMGMAFNVAYVGKDMGSLKFSGGAGDIPLAIFGELQKAQAAGKEPDFTALMPELQNVSFSGFTFRFEDNSITKKVLPIAAAMQGMNEAAMVANAGAMLQIGLMQLNNQAFTEQVVGAVNSFLKDPRSITVE